MLGVGGACAFSAAVFSLYNEGDDIVGPQLPASAVITCVTLGQAV